jgi:hypothetical protein
MQKLKQRRFESFTPGTLSMRTKYKQNAPGRLVDLKRPLIAPDSPDNYQLSGPLLDELLEGSSHPRAPSTWITQIADVCASAPSDEVNRPTLYSSPLFSTIRCFLECGSVDSVHRAMLCLKHIFENMEPDGAERLFQHLQHGDIVKAVIDQFPSPCVLRDSLSIRCTLAQIFYSISEDHTIANAAAVGLKDHIVTHLETIDWVNTPSALWTFLDSLLSGLSLPLIEFRECIAAIIGQQFSFADHHHAVAVNRTHQIAQLFATPAAKLVDWRRLLDLELLPAIADLLGSDDIDDVDLAMLCLKNIFENMEVNGATQLFRVLDDSGIITDVVNRFESTDLTLDSISIRCILAAQFSMISENWTIAEKAVVYMRDQIVAHLQMIDWEDSAPELWNFVATLPSETSDTFRAFREDIVAIIGEQIAFVDHRLGLPLNRVHQIAYLFATPAAKLVDYNGLLQSELFPVIATLLDSDTTGAADIAMLCLKNIFENMEVNGATRLFGHLCDFGITNAVIRRFESTDLTLDSLSIRCTLAQLFYSISMDSTVAPATVLALTDHIVTHLDTIDWTTSPSAIWTFVDTLPRDLSQDAIACRARIVGGLLTTLTLSAFAGHDLVPSCVPVLSIVDSVCKSEEQVVDQCFRQGIPTMLLQHALETVCDDSACACLTLLGRFVAARPDESPVSPDFVTEVLESEPAFLDDLMPLAVQTWTLCTAPLPWLLYVIDYLEKDRNERPLSARMFCGTCICVCLSRLTPADLPPMERVVPRLCDMLPCPGSNTEALLAMILRYAPAPGPIRAPEHQRFLAAVDSLEEGDLTTLVDDGSQNAATLLNVLQLLARTRDE